MKSLRFRHKVKYYLERLTGYRFYANPPHGHRTSDDILRKGYDIRTVFDVGANIGQSALAFHETFPHATVYSFEPVEDLYRTLCENTAGTNTKCLKLGLGSEETEATIYLTSEGATTNSLIRPKDFLRTETISMRTLDRVVEELGVTHMDYLKIDAEGFDMEVLKGANTLLTQGRALFVQVETGFDPGDSRHVLFDDVREFLLKRGYGLFGFYSQTLEWDGKSRLRFADSLFVRENVAPSEF